MASLKREDKELFLNTIAGLKKSDFAPRMHEGDPKPKKAKARVEGPEAVMDLHAMTLEVALLRTEEFIKRCQLKKMLKVLIIHGKGSGVLKEGVRRYLAQHPGVVQIEDAERQQGGSGAVRVTLRR